jgi:hypothetical protein
MPNSIKYSASAQTLALKKGNFWIGTGDVGKGPTSTTDYYNGITPPSGGYTIYLNKATQGPAIYTAGSDAALISLGGRIAGQTFETAGAALAWFATQNDKMVFNIDYPAVSTNGLVLNIDAGFAPSYPTTGNTWYDLTSSANNGTLTNGPTFNSANNGSIVFDGANDYVSLSTTNMVSGWSQLTYNVWVNVSQISPTYWPGFISSYTVSSVSNNISVGQWNNTQQIWYEIDTANGNFYGNGPGNNSFTLNTWFNVCMVYDGSNVYGYLNNTLDKQFSATGNLSAISSLNIGCHDPSTGGGFLNGRIAIAQIYNRALSATEVTQNFNSAKSRFGL